MEISGLDPKLTKCKFAVLPIKLYPPLFCINFIGLSYPLVYVVAVSISFTSLLVILGSIFNLNIVKRKMPYPKNDLNVYDLYQRSLSSSCLPIPALGCSEITHYIIKIIYF